MANGFLGIIDKVRARQALWLAFLIGIVILVVYAPSLSLGFWTDDYEFLERAGRPALAQFASNFFLLGVRAFDFRPLRAVQWIAEYQLFGGNPFGYHFVQLLTHIGNCIWLFFLVRRLAHSDRAGFVSALVFGTLPLYSVAIFWTAVPDPIAVFFYLPAIWFWTDYLETGKGRALFLVYVCFILSLMSKELAATLPATLFLLDILIIRKEFSLVNLIRRYFGFGLVISLYLGSEIIIQRTQGFYVSAVGYSIGPHVLTNLVEYFSVLAFPWGLDRPFGYVWLAIAGVGYLFVMVIQRSRVLLFLAANAVLAIATVLPFPYTSIRWLYFLLIISGIILGLALSSAWNRFARIRGSGFYFSGILVLMLLYNGASVADHAAGYADLVRSLRVPFRDFSQRHPQLQPGTLVYWINPPISIGWISGMSFQRYSASVKMDGTDHAYQVDLYDSNATWVVYYEGDGTQKDLMVAKERASRVTSSLPANFGMTINLESIQLASLQVKRGSVLIAIISWVAHGPIDTNYTVFSHLVAADGEMLAGVDSPPSGGKKPTSTWKAGEKIIDWILIPIDMQVPMGKDSRLEVGLYDPLTQQRLPIIDANGRSMTDTFVIEPFEVVDN